MFFGLKNAAQSFQRRIIEVLGDLNCFDKLDDILLASTNVQEHFKDTEHFHSLNFYGFKLYIEKFVYCVKELQYVGFSVIIEELAP